MTSPTVYMPPRHYLNDGYGIKSWLLTRDHKRIGLLYLAAITVFFFVGGAMAVLIRLELATRSATSSPTRPTTSCSRCTA